MAKVFTCEHCRKAPLSGGFRRNCKWKTEKGLANHRCYKDVQLENTERAARQATQREVQLKQAIATAKFQIGDMIHYYGYTVTKPTHIWRGDRRVKVRYEEERGYWADSGVVEGIQINGYKIHSRIVPESHICESEEVAVAAALLQQKKYNESCEFAARCR